MLKMNIGLVKKYAVISKFDLFFTSSKPFSMFGYENLNYNTPL